MRTRALVFGFVMAAVAASQALENGIKKEPRRIMRQVLEDKIRGGWAGQMIGVSYGAPTEFRSNGKIIEGNLPWTPDRVSNAIDQDDLYVDMTLAETMERLGLDATSLQSKLSPEPPNTVPAGPSSSTASAGIRSRSAS